MNKSAVTGGVGLVMIAGLAGLLWSQSEQPRQSVAAAWPPAPELIVNEVGERTFGKGRSTADIYSVPEDHWLVVTDFRRFHTGNLDPELDLMMRRSGARKPEMVLPFKFSETSFGSNFGSVTGLMFPPASTVVLRRNERGSASQKSEFLLVGYLIPS